MRMTQVRVKIIPIEDCSWDCSMKEVPINHLHYDQMYQRGCALSVDEQALG